MVIICVGKLAIQPNKAFYAEDRDSIDVMFFGTSFCYCTFVPEVISDYGISSYNFGRAQQTLSWTYYQMRDALKYQNPDVIVLEPYAITYKDMKSDDIDIGIANGNFDRMKFSSDSWVGAYSNVPLSRLSEFIFPITRWHNSPDMIGEFGCPQRADPYRGYVLFSRNGEAAPPSDAVLNDKNIIELSDTSEKYFFLMYDLAKEHGAELLIIRAPFPWCGKVTE